MSGYVNVITGQETEDARRAEGGICKRFGVTNTMAPCVSVTQSAAPRKLGACRFRCAYSCPLPQPRSETHLQNGLKRVSGGIPRDSCCFFPPISKGKCASCRSPGGHFLHLTGPACYRLLRNEGGGDEDRGGTVWRTYHLDFYRLVRCHVPADMTIGLRHHSCTMLSVHVCTEVRENLLKRFVTHVP